MGGEGEEGVGLLPHVSLKNSFSIFYAPPTTTFLHQLTQTQNTLVPRGLLKISLGSRKPLTDV